MPDKSPDRPTVPEVAAVLREYRKLPHRLTGGCVHIVVDDSNVAQGDADACLASAADWGREWGGNVHVEKDVEIATLVASLTVTQRRKLAAMNTYP